VLDPILEAFIEDDLSVDEICARGFDRPTVVRVLDLVKRNEYKRRQAPPVYGFARAFGRDWATHHLRYAAKWGHPDLLAKDAPRARPLLQQ
jgi:hypothetical protein